MTILPGLPFLLAAIYLSALVALVTTAIETGMGAGFLRKASIRTGKFIIFLLALGILLQGLDLASR